MFIFKETGLRANPHASYTDSDGVTYHEIPKHLLEEINEPQAPEDYSEELYFRTEQDSFPYVIYTKKPDEMIEDSRRMKQNTVSRAYLAETDWYVTRFMETGEEIPEEVKTARRTARESIK